MIGYCFLLLVLGINKEEVIIPTKDKKVYNLKHNLSSSTGNTK